MKLICVCIGEIRVSPKWGKVELAPPGRLGVKGRDEFHLVPNKYGGLMNVFGEKFTKGAMFRK